MKTIYKTIIIVLFCFAPLSYRAAFCNTERGPRIYLPATVIDLGQSLQGETASGEFIIRNEGNAPLNIIGLRPSCGCTVAEPETKVVSPGKEVKVKVSIDTKGKVGNIKKSVSIKTDDPLTHETKVDILTRVLIREHMTMGQEHTLFQGKCAQCHAKPAEAKSGEALFEAICAVCHGHYGLGGLAKRINDLDYLARHKNNYIRQIIADGKKETSMPGFAKIRGGPLDDAQIDSLVELIRWWEQGFIFKANSGR